MSSYPTIEWDLYIDHSGDSTASAITKQSSCSGQSLVLLGDRQPFDFVVAEREI